MTLADSLIAWLPASAGQRRLDEQTRQLLDDGAAVLVVEALPDLGLGARWGVEEVQAQLHGGSPSATGSGGGGERR